MIVCVLNLCYNYVRVKCYCCFSNQFASNSTTKQMLSGYSSSSDDEDNVNVEGPNSENLDKSAHFSSALPTGIWLALLYYCVFS